MIKKILLTSLCLAAVVSCGNRAPKSELQKKIDSYAVFQIGSPYMEGISDNGKEVLNLFRKAADEVDNIFWEQTFGDKNAIMSMPDGPAKDFALINYGPWDKISGKSFVEGFANEPAGRLFYPSDMSVEEWEEFDDPDKSSPYTLIKRDVDGSLKTVWYHDEYKDNINKICDYLKAAADLTIVPSVREYLLAKIDGLRSDSYEQSAIKWLEMGDSKMDLVLGPNESSDDHLHGIKRSYSAYVVLKNLERTEQMRKFSAMMPELQAALPCQEKYKGFNPGSASTIYVCDALYYAGAANCGIKDIAISLPFDTKVQEEMGTRCILMQNVISAKFNGILIPTADLIISDADRDHVNDKAFFWNVAFREVAHGLGVKNTLDGRPVAAALDNMADVVEEVKALAMGPYFAADVINRYEVNDIVTANDCYATFLTALLRSARFGTEEYVGKANVICYNYLKQRGAFERHQDACYYINYAAFAEALKSLVTEVLEIQGNGDYQAAAEFVKKYEMIDKDLNSDVFNMMLEGIPVDVKFNFVW